MTATATADRDADRASPATLRFTHLPALDGLRGLAVLLVVAYHAQFPWAAGGWLGIDVFFVLSGFLITTLAISETGRTGTIDVMAFWRRRIKRLMPLLVVVVAAVVVWASVGAPANELGAIRRDGLGSLFYVSNWVQIRAGVGYFSQFANPSPLTHTWSLAVEEQYYLLWPLIMVLVLRAGQARRDSRTGAAWRDGMVRIGIVAAVGVGLSATASLLLSLGGASPDRIYFGTDTRAQSLLIGSVLAVLRWGTWTRTQPDGSPTRRRRPLDVLGFVAIAAFAVVTVTDLSATVADRGGFLLAGVAVAVVIAAAVTNGSIVGRILAWPPLVALGRVSYGIYLWHWPVFAVLSQRRIGWSWGPTTALRLAVTLGLSIITFVGVEEMFRRRVRWSLGLLPIILAVLSVGLVAATSGAVASDAERFLADQHRNAAPPTVGPVAPPTATAPAPAPLPPTPVLIVGDSFGSTVAAGWAGNTNTALENTALENTVVTDATFARCGPFRSPADIARRASLKADAAACGDWRVSWPAALAASHPKVVVVAVRSWLAVTQNVELRTVNFQVDIAKPQLLASDEMSSFVDLAVAAGATVVFAVPPSGAFARDEAGAVAQYGLVAPRLATIRPEGMAVLDLGASCAPTCTATSFGLERSPTGSVPTAAAVPALRAAVATDARARDVARAATGIATTPNTAPTARPTARPKVLLVGDSVGWSLGSYWYGAATTPPPDAPLVVWNRATYECELDRGARVQTDGLVALSRKCATWRQDWASDVDRFHPDLAVTMIGAWEVFDRQINGRRVAFASPEWDTAMSAIFDQAIATLAAQGARVVLLTQPATTAPRVPGTPREWWAPSEHRFDHLNDLIRAAAARRPDVATVIDLARFVCPTSPCPRELTPPGAASVTPRPDGVHYDVVGSPVVARWLESQLAPLRRVTEGAS